MAKRKVCYKLYVGDEVVAVGDIDFIAETLGVSVSAAQRYPYKGHCPKELKLESLPVLYEWNGALLTIGEVAKSAGVAESTVVSSALRGQWVKGHPIRKFEYGKCRMRVDRIDYLRRRERERIRELGDKVR